MGRRENTPRGRAQGLCMISCEPGPLPASFLLSSACFPLAVPRPRTRGGTGAPQLKPPWCSPPTRSPQVVGVGPPQAASGGPQGSGLLVWGGVSSFPHFLDIGVCSLNAVPAEAKGGHVTGVRDVHSVRQLCRRKRVLQCARGSGGYTLWASFWEPRGPSGGQ